MTVVILYRSEIFLQEVKSQFINSIYLIWLILSRRILLCIEIKAHANFRDVLNTITLLTRGNKFQYSLKLCIFFRSKMSFDVGVIWCNGSSNTVSLTDLLLTDEIKVLWRYTDQDGQWTGKVSKVKLFSTFSVLFIFSQKEVVSKVISRFLIQWMWRWSGTIWAKKTRVLLTIWLF